MHLRLAGLLHYVRNDGILNPRHFVRDDGTLDSVIAARLQLRAKRGRGEAGAEIRNTLSLRGGEADAAIQNTPSLRGGEADAAIQNTPSLRAGVAIQMV